MNNLTVFYDQQKAEYLLDRSLGPYFVCAACFGVLVNILTISTLAVGTNIGKKVKIQLINLAVADCLLALLYPGLIMTELYQYTFDGQRSICKLYRIIAETALHASPISSAAISVERFVIVFYPFKSKVFTRVTLYKIVYVTWALAFFPEFFSYLATNLSENKMIEFCKGERLFENSIYHWIQTVKYLIPASTIVVSYTLIVIKLCLRKRKKVGNSTLSKMRQDKIDKVMLLVNAFLSLSTWLPYNVYNSFTVSNAEKFYSPERYQQTLNVEMSLAALLASNSYSTPIIYFIFNSNFRAKTDAAASKSAETAELTQQQFKWLRAVATAARCAETSEQMQRQKEHDALATTAARQTEFSQQIKRRQ
ncbi:growth hormone secretagogue receptor type 1-like [Watersipora subatra]|uniref:growth hormone secretagogue receptor type 1-like n=1 Tax=Watersipora subatra TaxID=2589382 RepID=UPI00355C2060